MTHLGGVHKFWYDANGDMTKRIVGSVTYNQTFDLENRLVSVSAGGSTTTFAYDAAGQRVKTQQPNGVKTYYPFPGYEEEVNGSTTTRRTTYSLAGQAIAVRVQVVGGSNTVYYLHTDHLGSTTALSNSGVGGGLVSGSTARYYPFGAWRTTPTQTLTDRGFTGHLENMELGLVYMNARYYVPAIGRFASADTIVPEPGEPQSFNRYSYTYNNPLNYTDPSGHRVCEGTNNCKPPAPEPVPTPLTTFGVDSGEEWTPEEIETTEMAALAVGRALARTYNRSQLFSWRLDETARFNPVSARNAFLAAYGGPVHFVRKSFECAEECYGRTISTREIWVYQNGAVNDVRFIVHELGHGFENALEEITGNKPPRTTLARIQDSDPSFPNRFSSEQEPPYGLYGFAGPFPGWQQSEDDSAGEEFADMYIGWTYNTWQANSAGAQRASFMSNYMPLWVDMALNH